MSIYKPATTAEKIFVNRENRDKTSKPLIKSLLASDAMRYDSIHELWKK